MWQLNLVKNAKLPTSFNLVISYHNSIILAKNIYDMYTGMGKTHNFVYFKYKMCTWKILKNTKFNNFQF